MKVYSHLIEQIEINSKKKANFENECSNIIIEFIFLLFFSPNQISSIFNTEFSNWYEVYNEYSSPAEIIKSTFHKYENKGDISLSSNLIVEFPWGKYADYLSTNFKWINHYFNPSNGSKNIVTLEIFDVLIPLLPKPQSHSIKGNVYTPYNYAKVIVEYCLVKWFNNNLPDKTFNSITEIKQFLEKSEGKEKKILIQQFKKIRVLDPSVGTGVFLIAAASILLKLNSSVQSKTTLNELKNQILEGNLFGVDIDQFANKICKLKLILWAYNNKTETIPFGNVAFNIFEGNSLFGYQRKSERLTQNTITLDSQFDSLFHNQLSIYKLTNASNSDDPIYYLSSIYKLFLEHPNFRYFVLEGNRVIWNENKNKIDERLKRKIKYSASYQNGAIIRFYAIFSKPIEMKHEGISVSLYKECDIVPIPKKFHWIQFGFSDHNKFDIIIGNPPFIALTDLPLITRKRLQVLYPEIYSGNNDLSYFFIYRSLKALIHEKGILSFILPKYLLTSVYAEKIRNYIQNRSKIVEIHDLSNVMIFKEANIRNVILFLKKEDISHDYEFNYLKYPKDKYSNPLKKVVINQYDLNPKKWIFLDIFLLNLFKRINKSSKYELADIVNISKGIETGCDQIFAPTSNRFFSKTLGIRNDLVKKWTKGKDIKRYKVTEREREVLYAPYYKKNEIESDEKVMKYLSNNKNQLLDRSRISNYFIWRMGDERKTMKWDHPKIVSPYKSSKNTFAIDYNGSLSSKDVIWLIPKEKYLKKEGFLLYLVGLLNSDIITFYSQSSFKDLGGIFEFYPKQIQSLPIRIIDIHSSRYKAICGLVENLMQESSEVELKQDQEQLNSLFHQIYDLSKEDIEQIKIYNASIG